MARLFWLVLCINGCRAIKKGLNWRRIVLLCDFLNLFVTSMRVRKDQGKGYCNKSDQTATSASRWPLLIGYFQPTVGRLLNVSLFV